MIGYDNHCREESDTRSAVFPKMGKCWRPYISMTYDMPFPKTPILNGYKRLSQEK